MSRKKLNSERLTRFLAPAGFFEPARGTQGGISFVRESSVERMYEHVLISAEGSVYAETAVSAATFTSCHACVSERDTRLRSLLADNSPFQTSLIRTSAEARLWEKRLIENADTFCGLTATEKGPLLAERLRPILAAVDQYVAHLGNVFAILDREFAFLNATSSEEQLETERIASLARSIASLARSMLYLNLDDARLASLAVVRFGREVEEHERPFRDAVPHRDAGLAARLILLTDFIARQRDEYAGAGGLRRATSS